VRGCCDEQALGGCLLPSNPRRVVGFPRLHQNGEGRLGDELRMSQHGRNPLQIFPGREDCEIPRLAVHRIRRQTGAIDALLNDPAGRQVILLVRPCSWGHQSCRSKLRPRIRKCRRSASAWCGLYLQEARARSAREDKPIAAMEAHRLRAS